MSIAIARQSPALVLAAFRQVISKETRDTDLVARYLLRYVHELPFVYRRKIEKEINAELGRKPANLYSTLWRRVQSQAAFSTPRTIDGVPIVVGDTLFYLDAEHKVRRRVVTAILRTGSRLEIEPFFPQDGFVVRGGVLSGAYFYRDSAIGVFRVKTEDGEWITSGSVVYLLEDAGWVGRRVLLVSAAGVKLDDLTLIPLPVFGAALSGVFTAATAAKRASEHI
jgi:hypothetical protein